MEQSIEQSLNISEKSTTNLNKNLNVKNFDLKEVDDNFNEKINKNTEYREKSN